MINIVTITHQVLSLPKQFCRLPVRYMMQQNEESQEPVIHCAIDVPREYIPTWLHPEPMKTTAFDQSGMHMVLYNLGEVITADARIFLRKLYDEVMKIQRGGGIGADAELLPL